MLVRYDPFRDVSTVDCCPAQLDADGRRPPRPERRAPLRSCPASAPESIDVDSRAQRPHRARPSGRGRRPRVPRSSSASVPQGAVTRQVTLGESLDTDRLEASYDAGVLTLSIPVGRAGRSPARSRSHVG